MSEQSTGRAERREEYRELSAFITRITAELGRVIIGQDYMIERLLIGLLTGGHVLLEGVPGLAKTLTVKSLATCLALDFARIQFTPDLLPADLIGTMIFNQQTRDFEPRKGPVFTDVLLADEINRATPRTQSALLEAMSEGKVSVDNTTHELPKPFHVIATQNPLENYGTYPLPESQLDRFLVRLSIGYPGEAVERALLLERADTEPVEALEAVITTGEYVALQKRAATVRLDAAIADYIMAVVDRTRHDQRVRIGVSTRGALAMARAVRALALVRGRDFCIPDDARDLMVPCFAHRLSVSATAGGPSRQEAETLMDDIASAVAVPT